LGARAIDATEADEKLRHVNPGILADDEEIEYAFAFARDEVYFTSIRILYMDKQGITGNTVSWQSIPYISLRAFSVETAGLVDFDADVKLWPAGMQPVHMSFKKDGGVDPIALMRLLNRKVFHPEFTGKIPVPAQPLAMSDSQMTLFMDMLMSDARAIDPKELETQLKICPVILDEDETVDMAFKCGRDTTVLTSKRCLIINVKGWIGTKVEYMSYLWPCVRAFNVQSAGTWLDRDAEMRFWTNIDDSEKRYFHQDLRKTSVDIMAIQTYLTDKMLGQDTAPRSEHARSCEGQQDGGSDWKAWFGDDQRMVDAVAANIRFHTTTPILQGCESIEMAFKGRRDMILFTTKRFISIDVMGWTGAKVSYTSIPWSSVQAFAVRSAGAWLDKDSEMMLWTDILNEPPRKEGENDIPAQPGMAYIEQDFQKDKVDLSAIGRFLASKCALLGSQSSQPPTLVAPELLKPSEPGSMEKFMSWIGNNARQVDPSALDAQLHGGLSMLLPEERVQMGFVCGRDTFVLTTHRAMKIDVQGLMGTKMEFKSIPYTKLRGYSVESAGNWDTDAELKLYFKAPWHAGCFQQDLSKGRADIIAIQRFLSEQVIGNTDGSSVLPRGLIPPQPEGGVNAFLSWLGDDHHQIDQNDLTQKLSSDPEILLNGESVELAFKSGRDLAVFTTKRFIRVDVQGWSGKRVSYTSVPYKYCASFEVQSAAENPLDRDGKLRLYTDSPATDRVSIDIRKGRGDLKAAYALLFQKFVLAKERSAC